MKKWPYKKVAFLEENNLVGFYYLSASEIKSEKRGGLWWEWLYKRWDTVKDKNCSLQVCYSEDI